MATEDNMALWHSVEKTDPAHTKKITGKPYRGDSPKPHWLVMRATETFGPCGVGWGFEIVSQQFVPGSPGDILHVAHIRVWYFHNGKRGTVEHVGQTMFAGKNKNGPYTDEDAPKKSVTDGLVKALSMIGFAGDIFLGRFDDSKYVRDTEHEFREAENEVEPAQSSDNVYMKHALAKIEAFDNEAALNEWYKTETEARQRLLDSEQIALLFGKARDKRKALRPAAPASEAA